jgi:cytoskeletal protein CcmA (bactofilin family)
MFGKPQNQKFASAKIDTLVGQNTVVRGDIAFSGGLHVEGRVEGNVVAEDDRSILILSENGSIKGEVRVPNMVLNGTVEGDVHASEQVELATRSRVKGNVYYNLIQMAMGAEVNGNLVHRKGGKPQLEFKRGGAEPGEGQASNS